MSRSHLKRSFHRGRFNFEEHFIQNLVLLFQFGADDLLTEDLLGEDDEEDSDDDEEEITEGESTAADYEEEDGERSWKR